MNDLRSPISFHPSKMTDHVTFVFTIEAVAGFDESTPHTSTDFLKILEKRMQSTGITINSFKYQIKKIDPYCGSKREKLLYDANCGDTTKED